MKRSRYVPLPQAARELGLPRGRVIEMIHESQLRAKLTCGRWWVEATTLEALLRARRQEHQGARYL